MIGRHGISLFVILGSLLVVSIFAFSMHWLAVETMRRTRRLADVQAGALLAQAAVACAAGRITEALRDPRSAVTQAFLADDLATGTILPLDTSVLGDLAKTFRDGAVQVTARVVAIAPLDPSRLGLLTGGLDPAERRCDLSLEAYASVGGVERRLEEVREVRVVHLMPALLGKFSLFVRQAESNPEIFNQFASTIFGTPDDRVAPADRVMPIVFKNGGELDEGAGERTDPESYRRRGYIYLGGGPVNLNLTAGDDVGYGESFHFSPLDSEGVTTGYFHPTPPPFFCKGGDFRTPRHPQSLNPGGAFTPDFGYGIRFLVSGFFTADKNGNNMNEGARLGVTFRGAAPDSLDPRMRSSVLHLFGNRSNPSPTLVLGRVSRRYVEYGGLVVEATGDNQREGLCTMLSEADGGFAHLPPIPASINAKDGGLPAGTKIQLDPTQMSYEGMFPDLPAYQEAMSKPRLEPYLRSHDFLYFSGSGGFEPTKSLFADTGKRAAFQKTCTIQFHPSLNRKTPYFKDGNLENLPPDLLLGKSVYRLPDLEAVQKRFRNPKTGRLELDAVVTVPGAPGRTFELPAEMVYEKGGILILEKGNLGAGSVKRGSDPDQGLTLVALHGNIELDSSRGGVLEARLVALRGKVINRTPSRPLNLEGGLAVERFLPDAFPRGGKIAFDSVSDPAASTWNLHFRAFVSDLPREVTIR